MFGTLAKVGQGGPFRTRSGNRDYDTDSARIQSIISSIETALHSSRDEQEGLRRRIDEVIARAAVTMGNDTDEYLDREPASDHAQKLLNDQISNGERRLRELEASIDHFNALKASVATCFPDHLG
jgi:hypothetical protein